MPLTVFAVATSLTVLIAQHHMVMFHYPRWSPDGKWIVLTSNVDGDDEEVWVISADGVTRRKLTDNAVGDTAADWHPDGRRIVFRRGASRDFEDLVMNADGSDVQPYQPPADQTRLGLTVAERHTPGRQSIVVKRTGERERVISEAVWAEQPSISPDGTQVVWEQRDSAHDIPGSVIAIWNALDRKIRVAARGTDPSWSADGRTLLFKARRAGDGVLFITTLDLATGQSRSLTQGVHPQWSPDQKSIVYMRDGMERADVYVMRVDGSEQRCLTCAWK